MKQAMKEQLNCFLPLGTDGGCSWDWHCVGDCDRDWYWPSTGRPIVACRSRGARRQARPATWSYCSIVRVRAKATKIYEDHIVIIAMRKFGVRPRDFKGTSLSPSLPLFFFTRLSKYMHYVKAIKLIGLPSATIHMNI